jgi:hypothetical protein
MKYFLKGDWEKEYTEVTKRQYIDAERKAGFPSDSNDDIATAAFSGHGIGGKTEYEKGDEDKYEEECY